MGLNFDPSVAPRRPHGRLPYWRLVWWIVTLDMMDMVFAIRFSCWNSIWFCCMVVVRWFIRI